MDEWLSVLASFLATFVGVVLAFGLTFWYDRHTKTVETRETKIRILEAIILQYQMTLDLLGQSIKPEPATLISDSLEESIKPEPATLIHFTTLAVDSAVGSGGLSLLPAEIQKSISELRTHVNRAEMYTDKILFMTGTSSEKSPVTAIFHTSLTAEENVMRERIPQVLKVLKDELERLKKQRDP